jgi:hypothetical protein
MPMEFDKNFSKGSSLITKITFNTFLNIFGCKKNTIWLIILGMNIFKKMKFSKNSFLQKSLTLMFCNEKIESFG